MFFFFLISFKFYAAFYYRNKSFCISLIVPSTYEDINRCYKTFIQSVYRSIKYPEEIVIVVSGISSINKYNMTKVIKRIEKCTDNLIIIYRRRNHNAASNRNVGYLSSHCAIISYFDVDDIMSIYRIYIIHKIFAENEKVDIMFHPSTNKFNKLDKTNISNAYYKYTFTNQFIKITEKCKKTFKFDNRIYKCDVSNGFFITNGWPTLKRYIMKNIRFNESLTSTEDLDFISKVVVKGYRVALFKKPLGYYIKDNECNFNMNFMYL